MLNEEKTHNEWVCKCEKTKAKLDEILELLDNLKDDANAFVLAGQIKRIILRD